MNVKYVGRFREKELKTLNFAHLKIIRIEVITLKTQIKLFEEGGLRTFHVVLFSSSEFQYFNKSKVRFR